MSILYNALIGGVGSLVILKLCIWFKELACHHHYIKGYNDDKCFKCGKKMTHEQEAS